MTLIPESDIPEEDSKEEEPKVTKRPVLSEKVNKAAVVKNIIEKLGKPIGLIKVSVTNLWTNKLRVNFWANDINRGPVISDSFFVHVSPNGDIIESNPKIEKKY